MQVLHKERRGLDPGRAEEIYITLVQMLKGYSCHFYNAVWVRSMLELFCLSIGDQFIGEGRPNMLVSALHL
jgi:hypothetical protein